MDKGMRNILIVLGILCLVSLISAVKFFQLEKATYQRYVKADSENAQLNEQVSKLNQAGARLSKQLDEAKKELKERDEVKDKYIALENEKKLLNEKIEKLLKEKEELEEKITEAGSDDFLARILKEKISLEVKLKKIDKKIKKTKNLEKEIEMLSKENIELQEQLAQEKEVSEYLSRDFLREKQEKLEAVNKLDEVDQEKNRIKIALDSMTSEKISLEKEISALRDELEVNNQEKGRLSSKIEDMEMSLKDKLSEVNLTRAKLQQAVKQAKPEQEAAVELPPIIVRGEASKPVSADSKRKELITAVTAQRESLNGKVMTINEEHYFVVLDIGSNKGVKMGTVFGIYRSDKKIANVRVVEVRSEISAADIISIEKQRRIKAGDMALSK